MSSQIDFDINDSLKTYLDNPSHIQTNDAAGFLLDCDSDLADGLTDGIVQDGLNLVVDAITDSSDALATPAVFDTIQFLLKNSGYVLPTGLSKLFDILILGLGSQIEAAQADIEGDDRLEDPIRLHHKMMLEAYAFLMQWAIAAVEAKAAEKPQGQTATASAVGKRPKAKKKGGAAGSWDPSMQLQTALETAARLMRLQLGRVFEARSERDTFVGLFTRPIYLLLENEWRVKETKMRMHMFKVLCMAVKHHGHAFGAHTSIIQSLSYFEHLSEPMAEFLFILADQYDHSQLADDILAELSNKAFNSNDTKGPRSVSVFITKLSELAPRLVMKQMTVLARFLDNESYTLRSAIIEVCGNLIAMLTSQSAAERGDHKAQISRFFDVLEERFLDINPYCRCRAIQVFSKLCDLDAKFPKRRQTIAELAARSLEDKSSHVRRNAIKLMSKLVATHPFSVLHGSQLSKTEWENRMSVVVGRLEELTPPELAERTDDRSLFDDATRTADGDGNDNNNDDNDDNDNDHAHAVRKHQQTAATAEEIGRLQVTRRYYAEALRFISVVHDASDRVRALLASRNKSELIEAMDFFVILDAFRIETARLGIRQMLRLVWTKGSSDDGKGVQAHLIDCYKTLFFDAPASFSPSEAATFVARNMISLTFGASVAELASLEQLLGMMARAGLVSDPVVAKLWQVYGIQKREISRTQRCGAAIVLSMLASTRPEIVAREMEVCLRIGLGPLGMRDHRLARYTCVALGRVGAGPGAVRLPTDHPVLTYLSTIISDTTVTADWFGMAEQAVHAIYALAKFPDTLCENVIRTVTRRVFVSDGQPTGDDQAGPTGSQPIVPTGSGATDELTKLLFLVGHVAIKQLVHLDMIEHDFKRRRADKEGSGQPASISGSTSSSSTVTAARKRRSIPASAVSRGSEPDELDLVAGTTEDDFSDAVAAVRERELLFGPTSLLAPFGALAAEICAHPRRYRHDKLQIHAALCLAKLMCVSSDFCDQYLGLFLTVLEHSTNPIIRSNVVIGLGDLAVCFNHLLDENTDFLYRRLTDPEATVKHTCLVTLTFLILAGQVKVKGQLGEMAKCINDPDPTIGDLAKMFFTELATKDNAVYNHFIDMFSLLSSDTTVSEDQFKTIIKFLLGFVEKDKYAKQLATKLASRLESRTGVSDRQHSDIAFVLGVLQQTHQLVAFQQPPPGQEVVDSSQVGILNSNQQSNPESNRPESLGQTRQRKRKASTRSTSTKAKRRVISADSEPEDQPDQPEEVDVEEDDDDDGDEEDDDDDDDEDELSQPSVPSGRARRTAALKEQRRSLRAARKSAMSFVDD